MSLAEVCAALIVAGLTAYAVLAGADFGAGFWDLVAGGPERGADLGEAHRAISARRRMAASASCAGRERRRRSHPTAIASPMYVSARSA